MIMMGLALLENYIDPIVPCRRVLATGCAATQTCYASQAIEKKRVFLQELVEVSSKLAFRPSHRSNIPGSLSVLFTLPGSFDLLFSFVTSILVVNLAGDARDHGPQSLTFSTRISLGSD